MKESLVLAIFTVGLAASGAASAAGAVPPDYVPPSASSAGVPPDYNPNTATTVTAPRGFTPPSAVSHGSSGYAEFADHHGYGRSGYDNNDLSADPDYQDRIRRAE